MRTRLIAGALVAATAGCSAGRPAARPAVERVNPGHPTCAAQVPGAYVWMEDTLNGARVVTTTSDPAGVEELRTLVQADARPRNARASGGAPMRAPLPPAEVAFQTLPAGQAVIYTARDAQDAPRLRQVLLQDVQRQQRGECSAARLPPAEPAAPAAPPLPVTHVEVAEELRQPCQVADSARLDATDQTTHAHPLLDQIARCLIDGALPGSRIAIEGVSLTPDEYRIRYGDSRAESVAEYLTAAGVDGKRIDIVNDLAPQTSGPHPDRVVVIRLAR